ncbi:PAS domain-containing protein [Paraburkholderia sp. DHOC27]|uniref:PAS domain-containing sensor histidine kinase n=1 Tax=Paraburkholderia sp. DHOC27 TaxID=2303330 RepID=UPI000E3E557E|nr:PAS domain-containing protein [Paraburkholderia sp. DHOC27]RFU49182.1 PAS domain S-box protein [Paraburkholderia sp. DHOC27]
MTRREDIGVNSLTQAARQGTHADAPDSHATMARQLIGADPRIGIERSLERNLERSPHNSSLTSPHSSLHFSPHSSPVAALDPILDLLFKPAASQDETTRDVLEVLFRELIATLRLDFVGLRAQDDSRNAIMEVIERAPAGDDLYESDELQESLHRSLAANAEPHGEGVPERLFSRETFQFRFTSGRMSGVFVAGASRGDFPSPAEQLVLNVAARKVVRDLGEQTYDRKQIALPALEQLAARMGSKLELAEPLPADQSGALEDLVRRFPRRKLVSGMPDWRLKELFDLVPIMAWSSFPDGTCEYLNKVHREYTGLPAAESRGMGWQRAIHPKDLRHRMDKWRESMASGRPSEAEVRIRRYDGVYRWFLVRVEPFSDQFGEVVRWYGVATDIEDRKRAEERWSASDRRLSLIINTIPMLIWSSLPDGHADFFNDQWYAYTSLSSSQSDGWGWTAALHPDDFRRATQYWRTLISTDDHDDRGFEVRFRRGDGEYRWFWLQANAMQDELGLIKRWYVTSTDIHDRKLAEEGVRRSEALLAEAQRLAGLGTFSWRVGSDRMTWSATLYSMFGFEPGTPVTQSMVKMRIHPEEPPFFFDKIKEGAATPGKFEEQIRIVTPDGAVKHLHYLAYATAALTGEVEYVGTIQDITERHLASEALAKARSELAQAARASSLGALTASIAHEVNQPLAGIVTNANTCLRMLNSDPPNIAGAIETARRTVRDGKRAADVISRLRNLFSQKEINASWWDLGLAAREVVELVEGELRRNRITLDERYDPALPLLMGDRIQLQQVILNLIRNAIDAVQATQGRPRHVAVTIAYREDCAHLTVEDTGVGFDASVADRLFEEFFTTKKDGMGIGLSVSRWIVEAHGGSLWGAKNAAGGATFGFSIPCRGSADADDPQD